jgi:hypothetical protein
MHHRCQAGFRKTRKEVIPISSGCLGTATGRLYSPNLMGVTMVDFKHDDDDESIVFDVLFLLGLAGSYVGFQLLAGLVARYWGG